MKDNSILIFKCLSDQSRLKIINYLLEKPMYVELISELVGLNPSTISFHLKKLEEAGLVTSSKEQYYVIYKANEEALKHRLLDLVKIEIDTEDEQKEREDNYRNKVISSFFEYGKLKSIPVQRKKKRIILEKIVEEFEKGKTYTEKEVNITIADINDDFCTIRRELIVEGLMTRDKGIYQRT